NGQGLSGSKVRNVIVPLQALYRHNRRRVPLDPTDGLDLPAGGSRRERAATPAEAAELLDALPEEDRALWATAFYAGLRRGELRALRWKHVHGLGTLDPLRIHVEAGWDDYEGEIAPKSVKGRRTVPAPELLRPYLEAHERRRLSVAMIAGGDELVFGREPDKPFTSTYIRKRALDAWQAANEDRSEAGLDLLAPIKLQECRHTYVSLMHAAGIPLERIGDYVGHSSTYMTDRYRHLLEGQGAKDAAELDRYLNGARTGAQEEDEA
ncbi:MAG TPA: site-specific integrase, partial [Gaiellaceae bacterium]|nr:site-specific integrase [Gaiellaceae bacterium]